MRTLLSTAFVLIACSSQAATITVTTFSDVVAADGQCSLREAITAANTDAAFNDCPAGTGEDVVELSAGTYTLAISGALEEGNASGDLDVAGRMEIRGAGRDTTVVDAAALDRVFDVQAPARLLLAKLTATNGRAPMRGPAFAGEGGAVRSRGSLQLREVALRNSRAGEGDPRANGWGAGGGALFHDGTQLEVFDSVFADNQAGLGVPTATNDPGNGGSGGALYLVTPARLERVVFTGNSTGQGSMGFPAGQEGPGGAIAATSSQQLFMRDVHFTGNRGFLGGAVYAYNLTLTAERISAIANSAETGGAFYLSSCNGRMNHLTVARNTANRNYGALLHLGNLSTTLEVSHATIVENVGSGIGVDSSSGTRVLRLGSSLVAGNVANDGASALDCSTNAATGATATIESAGGNVLGSLGGCPVSGFVDARIAPANLFTNALHPTLEQRSTAFFRPRAEGPLRDRGVCSSPSGVTQPLDQIGNERPSCGACDVGAIEYTAPPYAIVEEPAGAQCEFGGRRIDLGSDLDCDGVLEDVVSEYVCNGAPGEDGADGASGGTGQTGGEGPQGEQGPPGEAGAPGGLVRLVPIEEGAQCPGGGQRIDTGRDVDGDGALSDGEVESSQPVCSAKPSGCGAAGSLPLALLAAAVVTLFRSRKRAIR